jgi:hypothetical protein
MDYELIWWCVMGAIALAFLIVIAITPPELEVSQETIARIKNDGRHL